MINYINVKIKATWSVAVPDTLSNQGRPRAVIQVTSAQTNSEQGNNSGRARAFYQGI